MCTSTTLVFRIAGGSSVSSGSVCSISLSDSSNADSISTFQSLAVKNPSGKFASGFLPANSEPKLLTARHAHAATNVRISNAQQLLCAFGGSTTSDITSSAALASVECSTVSPFGALSNWTTQPEPLATAVAYAGVQVIGDYIYLAGGHTGMGGAVTNVVQRAHVLQPAEVRLAVFVRCF